MSSSGASPNSRYLIEPSRLDFQEVYDEFQPKVHRYLSRLVGRNEADDLTQEVFARVSQALTRFRGDSRVSTWVYRIATNTAFDRLRSPSFRGAGWAPLQDPTPATEKRPDIEQEIIRKEMNECIRRYVGKLPPRYRAVVILSEEKGLTNQRIAEMLGISLDAVKIRLHRARSRLKKELGSGCSLYRDDRNEVACEPKAEAVSFPD